MGQFVGQARGERRVHALRNLSLPVPTPLIQVARSFPPVPKRPTFCASPAFCGKKTCHLRPSSPKSSQPPSSDTLRPATLPPCSNPNPIRTILPSAPIPTRHPGQRQPSQCSPPNTANLAPPKPAHLPTNTAKTAAKTLPSAPDSAPRPTQCPTGTSGNERKLAGNRPFRPFTTQLQTGYAWSDISP